MYTIKMKYGSHVQPVIRALEEKLKDSRFTARFTEASNYEIHVSRVRLKQAKKYYGQSPEGDREGRRNYRYLEWDDWVEFHDLVNDVLDELQLECDVWTNPQATLDKGKKMWVRRGNARRRRWDWDETDRICAHCQQPLKSHMPNGKCLYLPTTWERGGLLHGALRPQLIWNHGTPDQFTA